MDLAVAQNVMDSIYNHFERTLESGEFTISGGVLSGAEFLLDGQYYLIEGSALNDGLHLHPAGDLVDEAFSGEVWGLSVPRAFVKLVEEIEGWQEKHPVSGYTSESFGGYSYSLPTNSATGQAAQWQDVFRARLNPYRRLPC